MNEIKCQNLKGKEAMYKLACVFIWSHQLSVQEAVYVCLPELWLCKCSPGVVFINTSMSDDHFHILKTEEELRELADDSVNVFKNGMLERYIYFSCYRHVLFSLVCSLLPKGNSI